MLRRRSPQSKGRQQSQSQESSQRQEEGEVLTAEREGNAAQQEQMSGNGSAQSTPNTLISCLSPGAGSARLPAALDASGWK